MIHATCDDGICVAIMTSEILMNKTPAEKILIRDFIEKYNYIDTIIQLPEYTIEDMRQKPSIVIMKKNRKKSDKILFINATENYEQVHKFHNKLQIEDIQKIIDTYKDKCEIPEYSYPASKLEICSNNYNMNMNTYIDPYYFHMNLTNEEKKIIGTEKILNIDVDGLTQSLYDNLVLFHGASQVYYDITPGAINTWLGYTSTSLSQEVAEDYSGDMKGAVVYKILTPKDTPIIALYGSFSETPVDKEILLKINQQFKVLETKQENGRNYVTVELINKPKIILTKGDKLFELTYIKNKMIIKEYEDFQEEIKQNKLPLSEKKKIKNIQIQIQKTLEKLEKIDEQLTKIKEEEGIFTESQFNKLQSLLDHYNENIKYYKNNLQLE